MIPQWFRHKVGARESKQGYHCISHRFKFFPPHTANNFLFPLCENPHWQRKSQLIAMPVTCKSVWSWKNQTHVWAWCGSAHLLNPALKRQKQDNVVNLGLQGQPGLHSHRTARTTWLRPCLQKEKKTERKDGRMNKRGEKMFMLFISCLGNTIFHSHHYRAQDFYLLKARPWNPELWDLNSGSCAQ